VTHAGLITHLVNLLLILRQKGKQSKFFFGKTNLQAVPTAVAELQIYEIIASLQAQ
jgi:hypothetical protein